MAPAKSKNQKMSLGDFLNDESLGSWADEMEDMPLPSAPAPSYGSERRGFGASSGFGGGFSDRGFSVREQLPLPDKPPFTAHIGNLSFDATEIDITDFFADCAVTNVRIVEDKIERRPKGFGYVEFGTVDGLKKALDLNNTQFQGRTIRISVAEPPKDRPDARELNDWTRKGPLPDIPRRGSDRGGFGSESGERRRPFEAGDGKVRDFGNWERKGPPAPVVPPTASAPREAPRDRRQSPSWGEGRSQEGSRPPRKEFEERPPVDRAPTAPELDNAWRARMRPDAPATSPTPPKDASTPTSPIAPAIRPKLQLQKRTVSEAEPTAAPPAASTSSDSKASPFGAARPIDTFAREREIEEKRQIALRQKKEQDDKAREEKRQAKEAAKAEKAAAAATGQDATEGAQPANAFKALDEEEANATTQETSESQNGAVVDDKAVKPQQTPQESSWRKTSEPTAENLEEDGWSTVSKARNNRRGGNQGARAIAS